MSAGIDRKAQLSGWPITTRDVLTIVTVTAVVLALRGAHDKYPPVALVLLFVVSLPLLVTGLTAPAAWRILKTRAKADGDLDPGLAHERFAYKYGLLATAPYTTLYVLGTFYPLIASDDGPTIISRLYVLIGFVVALSYLPLLLALIYSFEAFWGFRINLPLLVMRIAALIVNLLLLAIPVLGIVAAD